MPDQLMNLICQKCLTSRTGDILGQPCKTPGCTGTIEEQPEFSTLVEQLPEPMTCGRRAESGMDRLDSPFKAAGRGKDSWQKFKSNGNRVCSYCGSLHPDDLFALVKECAEAGPDADYQTSVGIEPSDKGYKIYVRQPGVRNAGDGAIKFYTQHLPRGDDGKLAVTEQQNAEYALAVKFTRAKFDRYLAQQFPKAGYRARTEAASGTVQ